MHTLSFNCASSVLTEDKILIVRHAQKKLHLEKRIVKFQPKSVFVATVSPDFGRADLQSMAMIPTNSLLYQVVRW